MPTGHTEVSRVVAARDAGANEFLAEPVSARLVCERLFMIIDHPRARHGYGVVAADRDHGRSLGYSPLGDIKGGCGDVGGQLMGALNTLTVGAPPA